MSAEVFTDAAGRRFESSSKGWRPIDEVIEEVESGERFGEPHITPSAVPAQLHTPQT